MTSSASPRQRWLVPLVAAGVIATGVALPRLAGAASPELPERTAAELVEAVSTAEVEGLSGTVVATRRLVPDDVPQSPAGSGAGSLPSVLSGSTTAEVWTAGPERTRVVVDTESGQHEVVRDGTDLWVLEGGSSQLAHLVLPGDADGGDHPALPEGLTPQEAAQTLLSHVEPSTQVSVGRTAVVADRAAYELVLDPRDAGTLVDTVRIAVDGETFLPLRVQVFAVGQPEPAVELGFSAVDLAVPDESVFVPPAGATLHELTPGDPDSVRTDLPGAEVPGGEVPEPEVVGPEVLGSGWTSVLQLAGPRPGQDAPKVPEQLGTAVEGGRVVSTPLVSVLLLDDGRVLLGAVPAQRLVEVAADAG